MKRFFVIAFVLIIWAVSIGAERNEPLQNDGHIDFEAAGFQKIYATAYILKGTTASGGTTRSGICACNPHLGDTAIIYTLKGQYLGLYECTDCGGTDGLKAGTVVDIWKANMTQAESFMKLIGPEQKVYIKWIEGNG